jgi:predicted ABC-type ATPase
VKQLYVIAGPNGAGKTTATFTMLPGVLDWPEFVNADEIARGISPFHPERLGLQAGRLMLLRIHELLERGESFAFETTLSSKSYGPFIQNAQKQGYSVTLLFFYLKSPEIAIERVSLRVREGGHFIPDDVVRRRYESGLRNLFGIFIHAVDSWFVINNSQCDYNVIARGQNGRTTVVDEITWSQITKRYSNGLG